MKKGYFYIIFFVSLTIVFLILVYYVTGYKKDFDNYMSGSVLSKRSTVKPFSFTSQDSATITNRDMLGKVCVVEYFFTTCEGICPIMNNNMQTVYNTFKNEDDFLIVSHTCKPEEDSVPLLKDYAARMKSDLRHWIFVTGSKDSLYKMARFSYGIDDPNNAVNNIKDDFLHSQFFALVDKTGSVRGGVYDGTKKEDIAKIIKDIKDLLKEPVKKGNFNGVFAN